MKSKCLFIVLYVVCTLLTSCYVCERFYMPKSLLQTDKTSFKDEDLNISCWIPTSTKNELFISIWYDKGEAKRILSFDVQVQLNNNTFLTLDKVRMSCDKGGISSLNDNQFSKSQFKELPDNYTFTTIEGNSVYYSFDFINSQKILAKNIELFLKISLQDKDTVKLQKIYTLDVIKSCSFSIH